MKSITFRPLRRIKKTGKITVASYMQWNKVKCANYSKFLLTVNDEYKMFDKSELVYNHEGKLLFHFNYDPWEVYTYCGTCLDYAFDWDQLREKHKSFTIISKDHEGKEYSSYHWRGADCSGTPTFTHYDEDYITTDDPWNYYRSDSFEPVTVEYVITWLGWFLYQLENSCLQIGK